MSRPRVLLITVDRVAEEMRGAAIRTWELAHALAPHADVTLAAAERDAITSPHVQIVDFVAHSPRALRPHIMAADVIVAQPQWPVISSWMTRSGARLIYDLYDPETLETLERFAEGPALQRRMWVTLTLDRLLDALRGGHHFICASEKQRDLWLGAMYAERLIAPAAYDRDPSFRSVINVVPFGLPATKPQASRPGAIRARFEGIGPDDEIVLWNGGIWNWLDPACVVRAFALLAARRPQARLVFMGGTDHEAARRASAAARQVAAEKGLLEHSVFFNSGWVRYDERADWLADATCAVATHREHLETRFAFRTRLLDCFWAALPVVCTEGDELADRVQRERLGAAVAPGDDVALADALEAVLSDGRASFAAALERAASDYTWPRVSAPLVEFVVATTPTRPLGETARGPWRRDSGHRARTAAYAVSHHALHRAFTLSRRVRDRLA